MTTVLERSIRSYIAVGTGLLDDSPLAGIQVSSKGTGYTSPPTATLIRRIPKPGAPDAVVGNVTVNPQGGVESIDLSELGSQYQYPPFVEISGVGYGAAAYADVGQTKVFWARPWGIRRRSAGSHSRC